MPRKRNPIERLESRILLSGDGITVGNLLGPPETGEQRGDDDHTSQEQSGDAGSNESSAAANGGQAAETGACGNGPPSCGGSPPAGEGEPGGPDRNAGQPQPPQTQPPAQETPSEGGGQEGSGQEGSGQEGDGSEQDTGGNGGGDNPQGPDGETPGGDRQGDDAPRRDRRIVLLRQARANQESDAGGDRTTDTSTSGGSTATTNRTQTTTSPTTTANEGQATSTSGTTASSGSDSRPILSSVDANEVQLHDRDEPQDDTPQETDGEKTDTPRNEQRPAQEQPAPSPEKPREDAQDEQSADESSDEEPAADTGAQTAPPPRGEESRADTGPSREDRVAQTTPASSREPQARDAAQADGTGRSAATDAQPHYAAATASGAGDEGRAESGLGDGTALSLSGSAEESGSADAGTPTLPIVSGALLAVTLGQPLSRLSGAADAADAGVDAGLAVPRPAPEHGVRQKRREEAGGRGKKKSKRTPPTPLDQEPDGDPGQTSRAGAVKALGRRGASDLPADGAAATEGRSNDSAGSHGEPESADPSWSGYDLLAVASSGIMAGSLSMLALSRARSQAARRAAEESPVLPSYTGTTRPSQ